MLNVHPVAEDTVGIYTLSLWRPRRVNMPKTQWQWKQCRDCGNTKDFPFSLLFFFFSSLFLPLLLPHPPAMPSTLAFQYALPFCFLFESVFFWFPPFILFLPFFLPSFFFLNSGTPSFFSAFFCFCSILWMHRNSTTMCVYLITSPFLNNYKQPCPGTGNNFVFFFSPHMQFLYILTNKCTLSCCVQAALKLSEKTETCLDSVIAFTWVILYSYRPLLQYETYSHSERDKDEVSGNMEAWQNSHWQTLHAKFDLERVRKNTDIHLSYI